MYNFKLQKIKGKNIVLLGEIHGVKENVEVMKEFIASFEKGGFIVSIGLEWPVEFTGDLEKYLSNTEISPPWRRWMSLIESKDGRISKEHIEFLIWLKKRNNALSQKKQHNIFCFSEYHPDWNVRDLRMANIIKSKYDNNDKHIIFAIIGNLYASKEELVFDGEVYKPLATHLPKKETVVFKCVYKSGNFFNHTLQSFGEGNFGYQEVISIKRFSKPGFDYIITIPRAHAITLLENKK